MTRRMERVGKPVGVKRDGTIALAKTFRTPANLEIVLNVLRNGGSLRMAALAVGVHRHTVDIDWRRADPEFAAAVEQAMEEGTDRLEEEAIRRGRDGVVKPVFQGGEQVGEITEYSDKLLEMMLVGKRSAIFGKRALEVSGPGGKPMETSLKIEFVNPEDNPLPNKDEPDA